MFNQFAVLILERLYGKKLPVLLAEHTGTTERTWRNRFNNGMRFTTNEVNRLRDDSAARLLRKMQAVDGFRREEAEAVLACAPSRQSDVALPTADLIYWFTPASGGDYAEATALAIRFDQYCDALLAAAKLHDIEATRRILLDTLDWLRGFCADESDQAEDEALAQRLWDAEDIASLHKEATLLADHMVLHVFSCWDVEFQVNYFQSVFQPYPLFTLAMPRLAPDLTIDKESGQLLRRGQKPKQKIFETSMSRLFDFLSVMVDWRKHHRSPQRLPLIKEMAAWCCAEESRIVSWRDETTRFTVPHLFGLWRHAIEPGTNGARPGAPLPMLVAAHLWGSALGAEGGWDQETDPLRGQLCDLVEAQLAAIEGQWSRVWRFPLARVSYRQWRI